MNRGRAALIGAAALGVAALAVTAILPPHPLAVPAPSWRPAGVVLRGVYHIHTTRSDGTGTIDDVAAAAARAGLQFVIVTDHGNATRTPDPPAYRSGVLCIDAVEISTTDGHYAALGLGRAPYPLGGEPRDVVEDVHRLGGFGIVAHPFSARPGLTWHAWKEPFDAVEWLNGDSEWRDATILDLVRGGLTYPFRPAETLSALFRRPLALDRWDELTRTRRVVTLAGTDAHARIGFRDVVEPYRSRVLAHVPSYEAVFRSASLQVWLPDAPPRGAAAVAGALLSAIRAGHVHTVVDGRAAPGAFEFTASSGGASVVEGDSLPLADTVLIRVRTAVPGDGWIVLFRDGTQVHRVRASQLLYASNAVGAYRAEVWLSGDGRRPPTPWIVGNPIYVGRVPEQTPAVSEAQAADVASGEPDVDRAWTVERDPRSSGSILHESGAVGLQWAIAGGAPAGQFAALATELTLPAGATGLAFQAAASRPMRVSVQLRAPSGKGGERWHRSLYLDALPRTVSIALADMTPVDEAPGSKVPRALVRSLLFVVDTVNTAPGSTGSFFLRHVRVLTAAHSPS